MARTVLSVIPKIRLAPSLLFFFPFFLSFFRSPTVRPNVDRTTVIARAIDDKDDATRKRASLSRGDLRALCNLLYGGVEADADPWRTFERAYRRRYSISGAVLAKSVVRVARF